MHLKKIETSYFTYSLVMAIFLTLILLISSLLREQITDRLIYNFFYFGTLNFIILIGLSFIVNYFIKEKPRRTKKALFLLGSSVYTIAFLAMNITYFLTGQVTRLQTILFIYKINPLLSTLFILLGILIGTLVLVFIFGKTFALNKVNTMELKWVKIFFYGSLFLLLILLMFFRPFLSIKDPLVVSYTENRPVLLEVVPLSVEDLIDHKTKLENPNVIFILLESLTNEKLGAYGYERDTTPHLDSLSTRSILFENAYTTATHSDYAQPAYLSSNYMIINKVRNAFQERYDGPFIWDIFKDSDYTTAYFSSQDDNWADMANYYNFDSLDTYSFSLTDDIYSYGKGLGKKDFDQDTMDKALIWLNNTVHSCTPVKRTNLTNSTYDIVCGPLNKDPFFLYLNLQGTHAPYIFPENFTYFSNTTNGKTSSERKIDLYDDALRHVDYQIGRLISELEDNDLMNNTIIIVTSDHGDDLYGRHGVNGHGFTLYDEEISVPLLFYFPNKTSERIATPVSHIDVVPTILDIMGINQSDRFRGSMFKTKDRLFFYAQNHKYLVGMLKEDIKIIIDLNRDLVEVYNITQDPLELDNLYGAPEYTILTMELLTWHYCQLNYFSVDSPGAKLERYCEPFRN